MDTYAKYIHVIDACRGMGYKGLYFEVGYQLLSHSSNRRVFGQVSGRHKPQLSFELLPRLVARVHIDSVAFTTRFHQLRRVVNFDLQLG